MLYVNGTWFTTSPYINNHQAQDHEAGDRKAQSLNDIRLRAFLQNDEILCCVPEQDRKSLAVAIFQIHTELNEPADTSLTSGA